MMRIVWIALCRGIMRGSGGCKESRRKSKTDGTRRICDGEYGISFCLRLFEAQLRNLQADFRLSD